MSTSFFGKLRSLFPSTPIQLILSVRPMSMSFMEYEGQRPCLSHNISYQTYIYDDRHAPLTLSHNTRENPRSYPVGGMHTRAMLGGEDHMVEAGPVRRRIAVAVSQVLIQGILIWSACD